MLLWGSGCGSVGRVIASEARDPLFESSILFNFNCIEKTNKRKNEPGMDRLKIIYRDVLQLVPYS